jgi:hypothetical protein
MASLLKRTGNNKTAWQNVSVGFVYWWVWDTGS